MIFHNTNGALGVIQLPSGATVPSTALYAEGLAHYATGELYVIPISGAVPATATYRSGRACTPDGALYVTTQAFQEYNAGIPQRLDGAVCVSALGATVGGQFVAPFGYVTSNTLCIAGPQVLVDGNTVANYQKGIGLTGVANASAWANQIGVAGSLLQASGASQPAIQADGSLLNVASQFMQTAVFTLAQPVSVYAVAKQITWNATFFLLDGIGDTTLGIRQASALAGTPNLMLVDSDVALNANLAVGAKGVITAIFNGASSSLKIDGTTATTGTTSGTPSGLTLFRAGTSNVDFGNFQIWELIVRKVADSAATQAQIQALLRAIHGTP